MRTRSTLRRAPLLAWLPAVLLLTAPLRARADDIPWSVRAAVGAALMTTQFQREELFYDHIGIVGEMQLAYRFMPWLDAKAGMVGGGFLAPNRPPRMPGPQTGGLAAPTIGLLASVTHHELRPYAQFDIGAAFTGALIKPFLRAGVGLDYQLTRALALGPTLGYGQVFQTNAPGYSPDARFIWIGIGFSYRPTHSVPVPAHEPAAQPPPPPPASEPPPAVAPSTHLMDLIERTLPADPSRVELLAPVLFEFDSDVLQPVGTAMLHEVARELALRPELELIEIEGYADSRGGAAYNRELSNRRAQRVFDWLVEHEVDPVRLRIAAEGATAFVEPGKNESEHEQNRRVVFRVLRVREP